MQTFIKKQLRQWIHQAPSALHKRGKDALIYRPRYIDGPQYIQLGENSIVRSHAWLSALDHYGTQRYSPTIRIGKNVNIGRYVCLTSILEVVIEDGCLLSEYVYISDLAHGFDPAQGRPMQQDLTTKGPVTIGENSFLGYRASVLSGVQLGKHCVVGAHSVVTRSFPDYSMVAGVPARLIKTYVPTRGEWVPVSGT